MSRLLLVHPGAGSPELLSLEAWEALTRAPVLCAPGDELGTRLRGAGYRVRELEEADPARLANQGPSPSEGASGNESGLRGQNLLSSHGHGEISPGARAAAGALARAAAEHGEVAFVVRDDAIVRAVVARAFEEELEVEIVAGAAPRGHALLELVEVMARLRGPGGCPWDAEQTHQSLAKHLLDETYELLEAIESGTPDEVAEELGDLLLQCVFHAQMGADAGTFDIDDVARGLVAKLVRRHPHVFGAVEVSGAREVVRNWDAIKEGEKERFSVLDGVPESLPALAYAQKLQRRASAGGFDWAGVAGALEKVREEAGELAASEDEEERERELGDLLFSLTALGRHLHVDAESALRRAARRFRDRLAHVEAVARDRGVALRDLPEHELEQLWEQAKTR